MTTVLPLHVVANSTDATGVLRKLARGGWRTREGFALPEPAWDVSSRQLVLFGRVVDLETAKLAVYAAARGAGVVAICDPRGDVGRALRDDLARIGPLGAEDGEAAEEKSDSPITTEQAALLARLADGETIAAAASAEYLSLRTANRRIASARKALGVATTREAVLAYIRLRKDGEA